MAELKVFDANAYFTSGGCPWTFFAFPATLAREDGFPADEPAMRVFEEVRNRGVKVGLWSNSPVTDTRYFACPPEEIEQLHRVLSEMEREGRFNTQSWGEHCEYLFSLVQRQ